MNDLNNILYFAKIVEYGSLSAAADAIGVAKSVLSQRLSRLEDDLGVRLVQRTTRRLQITDVGRRYYECCSAVLAEVERAGNVIDDVREVPRGRVRMMCPLNFAQAAMAPLLAEFMARHPEVEIVLRVSNEDVDMIVEGCDLALRIAPYIKSSSLIARSFVLGRHLLVASMEFVRRHGLPQTPNDLRDLPSVGGELPITVGGGRYQWQLSRSGETQTVVYRPRLLSEDLLVLKEAALAGVGVAELPRSVCIDELADGRLVELLPQWDLPETKLHVTYPSRDGLTLAVRTLIDYLVTNLQPLAESLAHGRAFRFDSVLQTGLGKDSMRDASSSNH